MKKILSILLAMAMLISSITVAFVAFAADAVTAQEVVDKINAKTAYIANPDNGDGTTHNLPGYSFSRSISTDINMASSDRTVLDAVMAAKYPEYADAPYYSSDSGYDYSAILMNLVDVSNTSGNVKKNSDAALSIGRDALKALALDADDVVNATATTSRTGITTYVLTYNNIDIAADEKVEDSVLADISSNYPRATGLDDIIKNSVKSHDTSLTINSFTVSITNIQIRAVFDKEGEISSLQYSYKLSGNASVTYINPTPFSVAFTLTETTAYTGFQFYNENTDFDFAELASKVNEGTKNIVDNKAGYDYARLDSYIPIEDTDGNVSNYLFYITSEGLISGGQYLPIALSALLGVVDKITIRIDDNFGTHIRTDKWQCKNDTEEGDGTDVCTAENPHQVWNCTCKDVAGCCTCCPTGTGCTSTHPCDQGGACRSVDCQCGYINDPACGYVDNTEEQIGSLDSAVNTALKTLGQLLNSSMGTSATEQFAIGATSANVPVATAATEKLDSRYAVKATSIDVFDIEEASFDAETGLITFTLPEQDAETGYDSLSHLTDDYITNDEFVEALKLSAVKSLGTSVEVLDGMLLNTDLLYSNIVCTVKFKGATADNMYGTGEIETINLSYDCSATSEAMIGYEFNTHMDSTAKNIEYADYEKGDVDMSTKVSLVDAKLTLRYLVDLETLNDYQKYLADMNDDGTVSIVDAKAILEKIASQPV